MGRCKASEHAVKPPDPAELPAGDPVIPFYHDIRFQMGAAVVVGMWLGLLIGMSIEFATARMLEAHCLQPLHELPFIQQFEQIKSKWPASYICDKFRDAVFTICMIRNYGAKK
jgi:hypothetical protein